MLEINPDIVRLIICRTRELHAKEQVVIPGNSSLDWGAQTLASHRDDQTWMELKSAIDDLEPVQQATLVALTWLGRGDFDALEWEKALQTAEDRWTEHTAEYLLGTPLVSDYLTEAMRQLGIPDE